MATKTVPKKFLQRSYLLAGLAVVILAAGGGGYAWYTQQKAPQNEVIQLQQRLSSIMELPTELPTLATVSDIRKLSNQAFFAHAQNGDKVLIYPLAKKAILYRPSSGKIINVGPIVVDEKPAEPVASQSAPLISPTIVVKPSPSQAATVRATIYNGTGITGLAKKAQQQLSQTQPGVVVENRADAATTDYKQTVVIDLSAGKSGALVKTIAASLKAKVSTSLPAGEQKPAGDILIILGADYVAK